MCVCIHMLVYICIYIYIYIYYLQRSLPCPAIPAILVHLQQWLNCIYVYQYINMYIRQCVYIKTCMYAHEYKHIYQYVLAAILVHREQCLNCVCMRESHHTHERVMSHI